MTKLSRKIEPYLFILPALILFVGLLLIPLINLIRYSFAKVSVINGIEKWVGWKNYEELLNTQFLDILWKTLIWVLGSVSAMVVFGVIVALLLRKPFRGVHVCRILVIIPWLIPEAFSATLWLWVLDPSSGIINNILTKTGMIDQPIGFLTTSTAMITVILVRVWRGTPFMIMTLLAALQSLPKDVEEAAILDGATGWRYFWNVILPHIRPTLIVSILILSTWTIKLFDTIFVMTHGGPVNATEIISIAIYNKAFINSDLGGASAIAIFTLIIVLIISSFTFKRTGDGQ